MRRRTWAWVAGLLVGCGAKTELTDLDVFRDDGGEASGGRGGPVVPGAGASAGSSNAGDRAPIVTGGRFPSNNDPPTGGQPATGGRASMGGAPSTGGRLPETGGMGAVSGGGGGPRPTPQNARLIPYVCERSCDLPGDCPSPRPYVGGCNAVLDICTITCEEGCPPGTEPLRVLDVCWCDSTIGNVAERTPDGNCCVHDDCGPPYHLPCCDGLSCFEGRCRRR